MTSSTTVRRVALAAGAAALVGLGTLSACATKEDPAKVTPASSPTATAPPTPTQKVLTPGPNADYDPHDQMVPTADVPAPPTPLPDSPTSAG